LNIVLAKNNNIDDKTTQLKAGLLYGTSLQCCNVLYLELALSLKSRWSTAGN